MTLASVVGSPSERRQHSQRVYPAIGLILLCAVLGFTFYSLLVPIVTLNPADAAFHDGASHKVILVTLQDAAGPDYACDDSDGASACQIHCITSPCMEPYRLCLAHSECHGIAINADFSFATLKASLNPSVSETAIACTSLSAWAQWWSATAPAALRLPSGSYASTCGDCRLGPLSVLTCERCGGTANGRTQRSSLRLASCEIPYTVSNEGGVLTCDQPSMPNGPRDVATGRSVGHGRHKQILVTTEDGAGPDYSCDDSDGPDEGSACQIRA